MFYKTKEKCLSVIAALRERGIIREGNKRVHPEYDEGKGKWYISCVESDTGEKGEGR